MKRRILQLTVCLLGTASLAAAADREFTSADGSKKIKASIIDYSPKSGNVKIKRTDGKTLSFPTAKLSEGDQTYIKEWFTTNRAGRNIALDVKEVDEEGPERKTSNAKVKAISSNYKLSFRNNGGEDIKDLNVKYQMFYIDDGQKRAVSVREKGEGEIELLATRQTESVDTSAVNLTRIRPLPASQCTGST